MKKITISGKMDTSVGKFHYTRILGLNKYN